jgi:methyl coenzyme M reductase alpha subunit
MALLGRLQKVLIGLAASLFSLGATFWLSIQVPSLIPRASIQAFLVLWSCTTLGLSMIVIAANHPGEAADTSSTSLREATP